MKQNPDVSIIVPAYNEEVMISNCLNSLLSLNYPKNKYEVIVVNDGSTDRTQEIIESYSKKYSNLFLITKNNGGKASAQNFGLKYAKGKYILITDSDAVVEKEWISKMVKDLETNDIVVGSFYSMENKTLLEKIQNSSYLIKFKYGGLRGRPNIGVNNGFHKEILKSVGGFDESRVSVTTDFIKRAENSNYKVYFDPDITVFTKFTNNIHGYFKQKLRWKEDSLDYLMGEKGTFIDFLGLVYVVGLSSILFISVMLSLFMLDLSYFLISVMLVYAFIFLFYFSSFIKLCRSNDKVYTKYFIVNLFLEVAILMMVIPYYLYRLIKPRKKPTFETKRI